MFWGMGPHGASDGQKDRKQFSLVCHAGVDFGDIFGILSGRYFRCFFGTLFLGASIAFWDPRDPKGLPKQSQKGAKNEKIPISPNLDFWMTLLWFC